VDQLVVSVVASAPPGKAAQPAADATAAEEKEALAQAYSRATAAAVDCLGEKESTSAVGGDLEQQLHNLDVIGARVGAAADLKRLARACWRHMLLVRLRLRDAAGACEVAAHVHKLGLKDKRYHLRHALLLLLLISHRPSAFDCHCCTATWSRFYS
jgi:hypothetical protein